MIWVPFCRYPVHSPPESGGRGYGTEGARRSSSLGTLHGRWSGSLVEGALVMPSPHPIFCAYAPSPTHSSFPRIPEPQVPENQGVLHTHSPYSESSGPPLSHSREPSPIPTWLTRGHCTCEYLLCRVCAYLYAYVWLHLHVCMNVCVIVHVCTHVHIHGYG